MIILNIHCKLLSHNQIGTRSLRSSDLIYFNVLAALIKIGISMKSFKLHKNYRNVTIQFHLFDMSYNDRFLYT